MLLLLSSYLYLLTEPVLEAFPDRIVNVHGSDLARTGSDGRPALRRPARRARGDPRRRVARPGHGPLVTERLDEGPILLRSRPYPVPPLVARPAPLRQPHAVNAYAFAHQEWMLATAWGPLLTEPEPHCSPSGCRDPERVEAGAPRPIAAVGGRP